MDEPRFVAHLEMCIPFYEICFENKAKIISLESEFTEVKSQQESRVDSEELQQKYNHLKHEIKKLSCISVVFASSGLENFIYKYALLNFTQKYYEQNLDRLSTYSKWRIIPKLNTGHEIPESSRSMQMLNELIKVRNDIIHYKGIATHDMDVFHDESKFQKIMGKLEAQESRITRCAKNSPDTVSEVLNDLLKIDSSKDLKESVEEYLDMSDE